METQLYKLTDFEVTDSEMNSITSQDENTKNQLISASNRTLAQRIQSRLSKRESDASADSEFD